MLQQLSQIHISPLVVAFPTLLLELPYAPYFLYDMADIIILYFQKKLYIYSTWHIFIEIQYPNGHQLL